jgi:RND superfamily putative drug exporter
MEVAPAGNLAVIHVPLNGDATAEEALDALDRLRHQYIPSAFGGSNASVSVGGYTAGSQDFFDMVDKWTPIVIGTVLALSFLILLVAFRSLIVPIKAIIMNLLSVGAAYGLLVLVFQHGVGSGLFGFIETPKIDAWIPLFMFSVLFGLSMDYHVFLLSRIREQYDRTKDNTASVAFGLRTTASLITGAALIMVAVFSAFAASELVAFQQMGFGLAVAIILDATVVRTVLVPATMELLGDRNWYFPKWLEWLPEIHIEGHPPTTTPAAGLAGGGD